MANERYIWLIIVSCKSVTITLLLLLFINYLRTYGFNNNGFYTYYTVHIHFNYDNG